MSSRTVVVWCRRLGCYFVLSGSSVNSCRNVVADDRRVSLSECCYGHEAWPLLLVEYRRTNSIGDCSRLV